MRTPIVFIVGADALRSASLSCCMDHSARDLLPTDLQGCESFGFPHTALKKEDLMLHRTCWTWRPFTGIVLILGGVLFQGSVGCRLASPGALVVDQCVLHGQHPGDAARAGTAHQAVPGGRGPHLLTTRAHPVRLGSNPLVDPTRCAAEHRPLGCAGHGEN